MGYFDSLLASGQIEEADGRVRFHPYGVFGAGYRMTKEDAGEVKRFLGTYYAVALPIAMVGVLAHTWIGWPATIALTALFLVATTAWYVLRMRRILAGAERVATRMSLGENARNMAEKAGLPTTILMVVLSVAMTLAGLVALVISHGWRERAVCALGILLFGSCLSLFAYETKYLVRRSTRAD